VREGHNSIATGKAIVDIQAKQACASGSISSQPRRTTPLDTMAVARRGNSKAAWVREYRNLETKQAAPSADALDNEITKMMRACMNRFLRRSCNAPL
jgi:hypothetical protein